MPLPAPVATPLWRALPIAPSEDEWQQMTADQRQTLLDEVIDSLSDPQRLMSEGRPHYKAKSRAADMLGLHFKTLGRSVYLAEEMAVMYPGEEVFSPDVLAVLDWPQPEEDLRMAWVVADEQRGLDLVLEVLYQGDRTKDLVKNVERYARLGIPEYFVYDRLRQQIHGFRLTSPGARRYQHVVPQGGRYASTVLGLDLAIQGGALRFYYGTGEIIGSDDLIDRLNGMVDELGAKMEQAEAEAKQAAAKIEQAEAEAKQAAAKIEQAEANARQAAAEARQAEAKTEKAEAKVFQAVAALREGVLAALDARGIACPDPDRARLMACDEPMTLLRWLARARSAGSAAEAFSDAAH